MTGLGSTVGKRTAIAIVVALIGLSGLVIAAPDVSAATNTKYCNAISNASSSSDPSDADADEATTLGRAYHKAADSAPSKIKAAVNTIGDYYEDLGDAGSNPAKVAVALKNVGKTTKAILKVTKYNLKTCL